MNTLDTLSPANLVIGPRPGKKSVDRLADLDLTHCCTLLGEKEDPQAIERICNRIGCEWIWLPIAGGSEEALKAAPMADHIDKLNKAISDVDNPTIYLHCSAGIHRTGYVAYIILRLMGLSEIEALQALNELRPVTADQVGEDRISWAEAFVSEYLKAD
ncbi:MAG: tyrosine-protein phosphatase [Pseudomonadota bacterium]